MTLYEFIIHQTRVLSEFQKHYQHQLDNNNQDYQTELGLVEWVEQLDIFQEDNTND